MKEGLRIPLKLDNPTAVATVLNQQFQKVRVSELRNGKFPRRIDHYDAAGTYVRH